MKPLSEERVALLKAADLIERDGWCQGNSGNETEGRCMMGAVLKYTTLECHAQTVMLLIGHLRDDALTTWNDAPGRTRAEVVSALRAAAVHGL